MNIKTDSQSTVSLNIRLEKPQDYRNIELLIREAFWNLGPTGCDEHLLAHKIRKSPAYIPELDYIAETHSKAVGHILYSKAHIIAQDNTEHEVITFGPLSVLPEYQSKGVGKALLQYTIDKAKQLGYRAIVFFGHPDYYPRAGFKRAADFGITTGDGKTMDPLMCMELYEGALKGIAGSFREAPDFKTDKEELLAFEAGFPVKKLAVLATIDVLLKELSGKARPSIEALGMKNLIDMVRKSQREILLLPNVSEGDIATIKRVMKDYGYCWGE